MTWFTAFSSLTLMLGLASWLGGRATAVLWVLLLNAALSCRAVLAVLFGTDAVHEVLMPPTGFAGWLFQAAWVPQHIAAASAVILAMFFLGRLAVERSSLVFVTLVLLAVAGYESSTWIGGVLFPAAAAMAGGMLLIEAGPGRRLRFLCWCAGAAILAVCLAWPLLYDQFLATGMRAGGAPIVVPSVRGSGNRAARPAAARSGFAGVLAGSPADRISRRLRDRRRCVIGSICDGTIPATTATSGE